jgi:hypothetical protein
VIDYKETLSPVKRNSTIKKLFGLAAEWGLDIDHPNVITVFLNGDLKKKFTCINQKALSRKVKEQGVQAQENHLWFETVIQNID